MKIAQYFQSASKHVRAFKLFYDRNPIKDELPTFEHVSKLHPQDQRCILRAIIGSYGHQVLKTLFCAMFSSKDLTYTLA